jgi:hypothetical protein
MITKITLEQNGIVLGQCSYKSTIVKYKPYIRLRGINHGY